MNTNDTIFAIASGMSRAAISVARVSGPGTRAIVKNLVGRPTPPRLASLATFRDPVTGEVIDKGLALFFPGPQSFTGEDCAEFHVHGSRAVISALLQAFGRFAATRPAEPGEFTRRALLNGKMDLAQVEGLADLIDAETGAQRRQALRQMEGALGRKAAEWRRALLEASALVEAEIDFSDEADVPVQTSRHIGQILSPVLADLEAELARSHAGERIREGLAIVIAGPPNSGKSTLLNALARRDVAIVTAEPGTTRDMIEVHLDLDGFAVSLIDTAGLRESADKIEQIGIGRALARAKTADLVLWLSEAFDPVEPPAEISRGPVWPVFTKIDLLGDATAIRPRSGICLSAEIGENLDLLTRRIADFAHSVTSDSASGLITRERHRKAFASAAESLRRALDNLEGPVEFVAEDLRIALVSLQRLTGIVDVEDILGEIFSHFCIGK
jgi:tRNA modification GTPase